jgi:WD40 repeat protein
VSSIIFSSNDKYLASGSWDKTVKLWSLEFKKEMATLKGHTSYILSLALSTDCKYLASGSKDSTIKLWNI